MSFYARTHAPVTLAPGAHAHSHLSGASSAQGMHPIPPAPGARRRFVADLSQCLLDFVLQLMPTADELAVKEDVRKLLERLIRTIEPDSRLLSFGSTANSFSLRNSDMDLCCLIDSEERLSASDLVTMVGDLLERETKFHVKPLPHARIPIVKLSLDASPGLPLGIACDIGFENRLALENTRLLYCYSMVDPARVRTLVLFLKVWSKRRKINSPYQGTLSSYGYVLLVIYFMVHVKNPPVLPNLQQIPPLRPIPPEEYHLGDRNVWFFDDIDLLRQRWQSSNTESIAELLIDFFRYYARDFSYNTGVASIRAGLLKKDTKGWQNDNDPRFDARERNRLCIEDPFEVDYNVARCVTKEGLYLLRGEFMRASRILQQRPERAYMALADLCQERDGANTKLNAAHNTLFIAPRQSIPPQTPYTVGSNPYRPKGLSERDRLSPPRKANGEEVAPQPILPQVPTRPQTPPEHMAPKRIKYTSPPPPEAPDADRTSFESRFGIGLTLATASTDAREQEKAYLSSSSNSEILSDDGDERSDVAIDDDVKSVRSATEPSAHAINQTNGQGSVPYSPSTSVPNRLSGMLAGFPSQMNFQFSRARASEGATPTFGHIPGPRGRQTFRGINEAGPSHPPVSHPAFFNNQFSFQTGKSETLRRSNSGPARANHGGGPRLRMASTQMQLPFNVPLPPSPIVTSPHPSSSPTIYYETSAHRSASSSYATSPRSPLPPTSSAGLHSPHLYVTQSQSPTARSYEQISDDSQSSSPVVESSSRITRPPGGITLSAQTSLPSPSMMRRTLHAHSHSGSTIMGPPTPAASVTTFAFAPLQTHNVSPPLGTPSMPSSPSPGQTQVMGITPLSRPPVPYNAPISSNTYSSPRTSFRHSQPPSPHLSSPFPHIARRHAQAQLQSRAEDSTPVPGSSSATAGSPLSPDVASPVGSPVSSASEGSASVDSGRSYSPISSTSPRTADFVSPQHRTTSPDSQQPKIDHGINASPQSSTQSPFRQQAQFRFSFQPQSPSDSRNSLPVITEPTLDRARLLHRDGSIRLGSGSPLSPGLSNPTLTSASPHSVARVSPVLTSPTRQLASPACGHGSPASVPKEDGNPPKEAELTDNVQGTIDNSLVPSLTRTSLSISTT